MLKKIVVIGPESTGKSTLCQQLAQHYSTSWCPEFAREYLLANGTNYKFSDLLKIAKGQIDLEEKYTTEAIKHSSQFLFIDTDMTVLKVWSEFVFNKCSSWILKQANVRKYDLYLLCKNDLPWIADELREYPDLKTRDRVFLIYKNRMETQTTPWVLIEGDSDKRLEIAIAALDKLSIKR